MSTQRTLLTSALPALTLAAALGLALLAGAGRPAQAGVGPGAESSAPLAPAQTPSPTWVPDTCERWAVWAECDDTGNVDCRDSALRVAAPSVRILGGGLHSNTGLSVAGVTVYVGGEVEYGPPPSICQGPICPIARVAPQRPMPVLYRREDFDPGGSWWNRMCQGPSQQDCHVVDDILPGDNLGGGLWVVRGDVTSPRWTPNNHGRYTFVVDGSVRLDQGLPRPSGFEPFAGSDPYGGSRAFIFSLANGTGSVVASGTDFVWGGMIYAPHARVGMWTTDGPLQGEGGIVGYLVDVWSYGQLDITQSPAQCPPPPNVPRPTVTPLPYATATWVPWPPPTWTPASWPTRTPRPAGAPLQTPTASP